MMSRIALALFFIGFLIQESFPFIVAVIGVIVVAYALYFFRTRIRNFYGRIEQRFLTNLNERETVNRPKIHTPWDSHLSTFELSSTLPFIGQTLAEAGLREKFGINIAIIKRGDLTINLPDRFQRLYPNDLVSIIGTDHQLGLFSHFIEKERRRADLKDIKDTEVALHQFTITASCSLVGKDIRNSAIREQTQGLVVGIERKGRRILNPESDLIFEPNDTVWMVAVEKQLQKFLQQNHLVD